MGRSAEKRPWRSLAGYLWIASGRVSDKLAITREAIRSTTLKEALGGRGAIGGTMQGDFFTGPEEQKWILVSTESYEVVNPQSGTVERFYTYAHTVPVGWTGPDKSDALPWEDD